MSTAMLPSATPAQVSSVGVAVTFSEAPLLITIVSVAVQLLPSSVTVTV